MGSSRASGWDGGYAGERAGGPQPPPRPARSRRRFWFDPRFALGLVLVAGSVAGVGVVVAGADRSIAVYAATSPLSVGDRIDAGDLAATRVRFADAGNLYLTPGQLPKEGLLVTRAIARGELVARSAVGTRSGASVTSVVVDVHGTLAGAIAPGAVVDVWAARQGDRGEYGPPAVLVGGASVVRLVESQSLIADGRAQSVEVLVPKTKVAAVLESIANDDSIALVPVNDELG